MPMLMVMMHWGHGHSHDQTTIWRYSSNIGYSKELEEIGETYLLHDLASMEIYMRV